STAKYLKNYPDVVASGANPFLHYVQRGRFEERDGMADDYEAWVARYDTLTGDDLAVFRAALGRFPRRPVISIVMPVYNTPEQWLTRAIESVIAQIYPDWQLCISDNASTEPHVRETLERYRSKDGRVRVVYRDTNGHISANSNSALALATGEYVSLLDSDDELTPHALFWVVSEILGHPDADIVYSDEDKLDADGRRYEPYFKSDWNPALILSANYVSHLGTYRRSLIEQVGGFRVGFEGSQDHDLLLRCADASAPERIRHIPRVLYHWRSIPGSTASVEAMDAKPYAWHAASAAIVEHLQRHGIAGKVEPALRIYYQVHYPTPAVLPKVSILMPSACNLNLLKPCMESLFARTTYPDFEVLLVVSSIRFENAAQREYLEQLKSNPRIRILRYEDRPYNFSWLNNWAESQCSGEVLCFMNDDIEVVTPDWLEQLLARLTLDKVGAVGPMLYYPDDRIQHAGVILGVGGVAGHGFIRMPRGSDGYFGRAGLEQDLSCVTAACMLMRRDAFQALNGFNEDLSVAFNDVDLCVRLRNAGWRIIWTPQVELIHHESATLGRHDSPERQTQFRHEVKLMRDLWGAALDSDPFYNPNLSLETNRFTLAFPPRIARLPAL
ncbi:MAG TPA: glycosyltransferase family 2 protein, partial [Xanthobacteraceae bacterium]|nr:glycosyltransferase family 2 protein [Xanthobacteraceae bacterium]